MTERLDKVKWERVEALASVGVLLFAIVAVYFAVQASNSSDNLTSQANNLAQLSANLTQQSLYLQNITSNFEPKIIPYYMKATVGDINTTCLQLDRDGRVFYAGDLQLSFVVITPHASIINFTTDSFQVKTNPNSDFINASNFYGPSIALLPQAEMGKNFTAGGIQITNLQIFEYEQKAFVQAGVTQLNFTVGIQAWLPINSNFSDILIGASLGNVNAEALLFDVQTGNIAATYDFNTQIRTNVNISES